MESANPHSTHTRSVLKHNGGGNFSREWLPDGVARGCFVLVHGMESHSGWFTDMAVHLNARGWAALSSDRPGWGKSPGSTGHIESYRDEVARISAQLQAARDRFGSAHLAGMSWGGMASLYFALRRGWLAESVTLIAPGLAFKAGFPYLAGAGIGLAALTGDWRASFDSRLTPELFSADPDVRQFIAGDQWRVSKFSAGFFRETLKMRRFIHETAGRRRLPPTLCLFGADDRVTDNSAAETICRRAGIEIDVIPNAGHALVLERAGEMADRLTDFAERAERKPRRARGGVWVIGGGAVGGAIGSLLSFAGHEVGVLARPRPAHDGDNRRFILDSGDGRRGSAGCLTLADAPEGLPPDPRLVVLAVKGFDTDRTLAGLAGAVPPGAVVASLQNGVANEAKIAVALPDRPVVAGVICAGLEAADPGHILWPNEHGGVAAAIHAGDGERARDVMADFFPDTGLEYLWIDGERAASGLKWSKLMLNVPFNALNAVTGLPIAAILRDPRHGGLAVKALAEGFRVMDRLGLRALDLPGFPVAKLRLVSKLPSRLARAVLAGSMAGGNREAASSMRQDFLRGRGRTEIAELNGAVVALGGQLGLATPANRDLCRMVEEALGRKGG